MALRIKCKCGKSMKIPAELADKKLLCPGCKKPFRISAAKFQQAESAAAQQAAANAPAAKRAAPAGAGNVAANPQRSTAGTTERPVSRATSPPATPQQKKKSQPADLPQLPDPAELDLLPAELDWSGEISMSQSDILADFVPGANKGAAAAQPAPTKRVGRSCPMCKAALEAGARICIGCGYDLRDGTFVTGAGSFVRAPVDGSSSSLNPLGSASDRSSGQISGVGAAPPKKQKQGLWASIARLFKPGRSKA